jgi:alpha-L-rhamnosidase
MTSFNHYALGAVANFLHTTVAGLTPLSPGYREILISPQPGGSVTTASVYTITPSGRASVSWELKGGKLKVDFEVPPNTTAVVRLSKEKEEKVGSGIYTREVAYEADGIWPPDRYKTQFASSKHDNDTLAL